MESVYKPLEMQYFYEGNDEHWALNKSGFFWQLSAFLPTKVCSVEAECGSVFVSMLSILGRAGTLCYTGVPLSTEGGVQMGRDSGISPHIPGVDLSMNYL